MNRSKVKMKKNPTQKLIPPYGDVAPRLLESIFEALLILCKNEMNGREATDAELEGCYHRIAKEFPIMRARGLDAHLIKGLKVSNKCSRLVKVTRLAYRRAQTHDDTKRKRKGAFLPSALQILYDILTVPDEPHTSAYALITCRNMLLSQMRIHPDIETSPTDGWDRFTMGDADQAISHIKTYLNHRDNYDRPKDSPVKLFLLHFLAMKGILRLRFNARQNLNRGKGEPLRIRYCREKNLIGDPNMKYEFRLSTRYTELPDIAELVNQLWGFPLPLRGADTILFGGLKMSSDGSLVISAHGEPGTGKTSLALAIAGALSPLGTVTYYITFEENPEDLKARLLTLIPSYLRKMRCFNPRTEQWFFPQKVFIEEERKRLEQFTNIHLDAIKGVLERVRYKRDQERVQELRTPCPLVVVVDGMSVLREEGYLGTPSYSVLHDFVSSCRRLGVVVFLLSNEGDETLKKLDYLVDTVISLNHLGTKDVGEKPIRLLQLVKTRQQISRPGTHIFHMSGERAFRISPQLPSQLDKQQRLPYRLPDFSVVLDTLNKVVVSKGKRLRKFVDKQFLDLYQGSQILLHGHGSAGKAGLGLNILMTPPRVKDGDNVSAVDQRSRTRILILSFLYPEKYYQHLKEKIEPLQKKAFTTYGTTTLEIMSFFPGFLRPEDLLAKITRRVTFAELDGDPYTGVLLDGLHNIFLQFPALQKTNMVWPAIYNVLVRSRVTTVTTFTTFALPISEVKDQEHEEMLLEGHRPLLHALVQATDFYLAVEPEEQVDGDRRYKLTVKETIRQKIPRQHLYWNREDLYFESEPNA
jgi:KaiC/GvpD/RAD55 family RecA-like ATPase